MFDLFAPVSRHRSPLGRIPTTCQGCGAADRGPLCHGCALGILRVHNDEHTAECVCADCGTWTRVSARLGAADALHTAREVVS